MMTEEEKTAWLIEHYGNMRNSTISKRMDWSMHHVVYMAQKLGLRKTRAFKCRVNREAFKKELTEEQTEWLKENFATTKNKEIAEHLGVSLTIMHRYARKLELKKSLEFMKECQMNTTRAAREANIIAGWPPKGYIIPRSKEFGFKKGESNRTRMGEERFREMIKRSAASMRKRRESEKRRVAWGLPQLTKLKVCSEDREKQTDRWYLKKYGYMLDEEEHVAYYDGETDRRLKKEAKGSKYYEFADISELEDEYHEEFRAARKKYKEKNKSYEKRT